MREVQDRADASADGCYPEGIFVKRYAGVQFAARFKLMGYGSYLDYSPYLGGETPSLADVLNIPIIRALDEVIPSGDAS